MSAYAIPAISGLNRIRVLTVVVSLLLSWLAITLNDQPNNDAYTYVRAAEIALGQDLAGAYEHYQWAHYSVLLAGIHTVTGIPLFLTAQLLNAALFALLSLCFVNFVALTTPSRRVVWLAFAIILAYPHLNEFRAAIIRDVGFLAFCLLAMVQLLRYCLSLRLRHGICFILACLAAFVFRPEAILFWFLTPFAVLFSKIHTSRERGRAFATVQGLSTVIVVALLLGTGFSAVSLPQQLGVFADIYQPFAGNVAQLAGSNTYELSQTLYGEYGAQFMQNYTGYFLLAGLLVTLTVSIIQSLGLGAAPLLFYGAIKRLYRVPAPAAAVMLSWMGVALVILLVFILLTRFTTSRYALLFCLALLMCLPVIVDRMWSRAAAASKQKRFAWITGFLLLFSAVDSHLSFGASRSHLDDATQWLAQNTRADVPLVTNEVWVAYHSGRVEDYDRVDREMPAAYIIDAPAGSIVALTPRRSFQAVLDEQLASGRLRLLRQVPAERGGDFLIMEKDF